MAAWRDRFLCALGLLVTTEENLTRKNQSAFPFAFIYWLFYLRKEVKREGKEKKERT